MQPFDPKEKYKIMFDIISVLRQWAKTLVPCASSSRRAGLETRMEHMPVSFALIGGLQVGVLYRRTPWDQKSSGKHPIPCTSSSVRAGLPTCMEASTFLCESAPDAKAGTPS